MKRVEACVFVEGMSEADFVEDLRTLRAMVMNLTIIGEAVNKIFELVVDFVAAHREMPWHEMRGMRNRMVHGYFDINLHTVWDTIQSDLPLLHRQVHDLLLQQKHQPDQ